jgi:hypothetical protein
MAKNLGFDETLLSVILLNIKSIFVNSDVILSSTSSLLSLASVADYNGLELAKFGSTSRREAGCPITNRTLELLWFSEPFKATF